MKKIIVLAAFFVAVSYAYPSAYAEDKVGLMLQSGDTENEVIERWGEPDKINRSYKEGKRRAVWIYNCEYQIHVRRIAIGIIMCPAITSFSRTANLLDGMM